MEHGLHNRYSNLNTPVHRLDPRAKVVLALAFTITVVSTPPSHLLAFVIYAGLLSWTAALARVPLGYLVFRAAAVLPFSALAAFWLPFVEGGERLLLFDGRLHLSVAGIWIFAGVAMKSVLGASAAIALIATTPFSSLLCGFRKLGAPLIMVDLLALTYRYLFVLVGEATRLRRAAAARGYRPRWLGQVILIGHLVGQLFLRSYTRAERVYGAMVQRGYNGLMPVSTPLCFQMSDVATLLVLIPTLVVVRIFLR